MRAGDTRGTRKRGKSVELDEHNSQGEHIAATFDVLPEGRQHFNSSGWHVYRP
jgi:hypothetical protein